MVFLDKLGWPVERVRGRPVLNALRLLIHTRKIVRQWEPPKFGQHTGGFATAARVEAEIG